MEYAIETQDLTRRFGRVDAVTDLTLQVPAGRIFALLGPNGAGKTTTIKLLMNLIRPKRGRAIVLGTEAIRLGPKTLASIGYVSENQALPEWMSVAQLTDFCRPFYPTWDDHFAEELRSQFDLDPRAKLKHLSRGMKVKAALLVSLAYRPRLLILDEPFSGLDPVVRDDLIRAVLRLAEQEHWTVFISSHDMEEVERLADYVAFLDAGRLELAEPAAQLLGRFRRLEVNLPDAGHAPSAQPSSWLGVEVSGRAAQIIDSEYEAGASEQRARDACGAVDVQAHPMTLREIFITLAHARKNASEAREGTA